MELFKSIRTLLPEGINMTMAVIVKSNGKLSVCTHFKEKDGSTCEGIPSFNLTGTAEELDEGFIEAITTPIQEVSGLISNIAQFKNSIKEAEKKATTAKPSSPSTSASSSYEDMRKKQQAEAERKKRNLETTLAEADKAEKSGNYNLAELLLNLASELSNDKKQKAELAKRIKAAQTNKAGFLCNDDSDSANTAFETFKASLEEATGKTAEPTENNPCDESDSASDNSEEETEGEENDDNEEN